MNRGRRIRRAQTKHTDDWLITYADTITLLLCLFVVLLASQTHKPVLAQAAMPPVPVEQSVAPIKVEDWQPPFQPITLVNRAPDSDADAGPEDRTAPAPEDTSLPAAARPVAADNDLTIATAPPTTASSIQQSAPLTAPLLAPLAAPLAAPVTAATPLSAPLVAPLAAPLAAPVTAAAPQPAAPMPLAEIAARVTPEGAAQLKREGDRITTLAFDSAAFFSRGDATLNNSGKVILQEVVGNLTSEEYRDYMVTVEGHTDDEPINTLRFPSNWELSTARAAAVVRFFIEQGVPAQRVRAAGYADTRPLLPNRDGNGVAIPENQAKNRRVVIGLEKIEHH